MKLLDKKTWKHTKRSVKASIPIWRTNISAQSVFFLIVTKCKKWLGRWKFFNELTTKVYIYTRVKDCLRIYVTQDTIESVGIALCVMVWYLRPDRQEKVYGNCATFPIRVPIPTDSIILRIRKVNHLHRIPGVYKCTTYVVVVGFKYVLFSLRRQYSRLVQLKPLPGPDKNN